MKRSYANLSEDSAFAAENLDYLEQLELSKQNTDIFNHLPEVKSSCTALSTEDVVKAFSESDFSQTTTSNEWPQLIRKYGYRVANTNPLYSKTHEESIHQLSAFSSHLSADAPDDMIALYCGKIAIDCDHLSNQEERQWLYEAFENRLNSTQEEKKIILNEILAAELFEKHLSLKYVGQKKFGLEGEEALIPCMNTLITMLSKQSYNDIIIGMAHRGRLNVMTNVCGMKTKAIFDMFAGLNKNTRNTSGDVKYHLGFQSARKINQKEVNISLACNPSHLEFIYPVALGQVRSRQSRWSSTGIIIHGDAAIAGQGVVMEALNMNSSAAYNVNGVIHITIDNQIGFTTSKKSESRTSFGAADVAKVIEAPILYVNADCPESVYQAAILASNYKSKFKKDIFITLLGYRRLGHNESDEPSMTQPMMYQKIKAHPSVLDTYSKSLINNKIISETEYNEMFEDVKTKLKDGAALIHETNKAEDNLWKSHESNDWREQYQSQYPKKDLEKLSLELSTLPENIKPHKSVLNVYKNRQLMAEGKKPLDWGMAELLAYATLIRDGFNVRLTGQDCQRGTFSHRHAIINSTLSNQQFNIFDNISKNQFEVHNSTLSEQATLGFEYGFTTYDPNTLTLWEAQFGDFANGAQVIIDQFITSGVQKWNQHSGLVMLLPHGHEGMGPEHTSGRIERFLQLCGQTNIQVCVPTLPSQIFHLLRRQMLRKIRIPLVIFSPKSLLRLPQASSSLEDLSSGDFKLVIDDEHMEKPDRVIFCTGKVYYDLLNYRNEKNKNTAIVRIEQLYPFPEEEVKKIIAQYGANNHYVWCQEEHKNQGGWYRLNPRFNACLQDKNKIVYSGRPPAASPAVGYYAQHLEEQSSLVEEAFNI